MLRNGIGTTSLYAISFLTNAAILVFEIAGGRLLAPYLGTSVGVWAGLIAVVLGGMAIGYRYGGFVADKSASQKVIGWYLLTAGTAALLAWSMRDLVPTLITQDGIPETWGAVLIGTILFIPTVIILAAISPMIAKNLLTRLDTSARVVGTLNAVGTIGSIIGAIGTGTLLVPYFGVDAILLGVAVTLFVLGALVLGSTGLKASSSLAGVLALALFLNAVPTRADEALADISTPYNRIFVGREFLGENALTLSTSPFGTQCAMYIDEEGNVDESRVVFSYLRTYDAILRATFPSGAERMLFLGGCTYSFPRYVLRTFPETVADAVEIDPGMTDVAEDYFGFDPASFPTLAIHHEDARVFLNGEHEPYDVIFMDALGSSKNVPFHLATKEMFESLSHNLKDDGLLVMNILGMNTPAGIQFPASELRTAKEVFPHASLYGIKGSTSGLLNFVLIASKTVDSPESFTHYGRIETVLERLELQEPGMVLTDNYAPIELLTSW